MTATEIAVKQILDRWNASLKMADTMIQSLSDESLVKEITPGKNRGIYLLGHLIAAHDDVLVLLGFGQKLYPDLFDLFIKSPDKSRTDIPSVADLRAYWAKQNEVLNQKMATLSTEDWFAPHTAVSAEDFAKEPHRNKLNIILTRTTHLQYHLGQLSVLK